MNVKGAKYAGRDRNPRVEGDSFLKLQQSSDITWLLWKEWQEARKLANLRYSFVLHITNADTQRLIATALRNTGQKLVDWPGTWFSTGTNEGKAIMGMWNSVISFVVNL